MNVSIRKINARQYQLNNKTKPLNNQIYKNIRLIDESKQLFFESNAIDAIKHWQVLDEDTDRAYLKALDIYDLLLENSDNISSISNVTDILIEGINKVRNSTQLKNSLKYRFGKLKRVRDNREEVIDAHKDMNKAISGSVGNIQSKKPKDVHGKTSTDNSNNIVKTEQYQRLIDECNAIIECDRIVDNYSAIHKRYNIDSIITNLLEGGCDIYECAYKIAQYIDTFNTPFKNRYNAALETCWYGLNKRYIDCDKSAIIEAVTDYYIFETGLGKEDIEDINTIYTISPIFDKSDFDVLPFNDDIVPDETVSPLDVDFYGADYDSFSVMKDLEESTMNKIVGLQKESDPEFVYNKDIKELINDFKKECAHKDTKEYPVTNLISLKALVNKISTDYPEQIIFNLNNLLSIIRVPFLIFKDGSNINDLCNMIDTLVDSMINVSIDKDQSTRVIDILKSEQDIIQSKLNRLEDNGSDITIDTLNKYKNALDNNISKLETYISNSFNDDEENKYEFDEDSDTSPDDDNDDGLVEAATIILISNLCESICEDTVDGDVENLIYGNIRKFNPDTIDAITQFAITDPYVINKTKLKDEFEKFRNSLRENESKDYIMLDVLNENILKLEHSTNLYNTYNDPKGIIAYLMCLDEIKRMNLTENDRYFTEATSFTNTLKIAINNLKRKAINLSEKEKQASNSIDAAINNIMKNLEKKQSEESREAAIRGTILPSASKCIKLALVFGITAFINPTVALIGALGAFFTKKSRTQKQRQLALDEIEIELKMCERYIRIYEDRQDMDAVRRCEIIQRNLQRQHQRIKYKMKVDFKHVDTSSAAIQTMDGKTYGN